MYETTNGKGIQGNWCHMNTFINNVQKKINISEKGPYTFKDLGMKNREINNWTRRRPMPSSTGRVTTGPWGWSSTSRHIENESKTINNSSQKISELYQEESIDTWRKEASQSLMKHVLLVIYLKFLRKQLSLLQSVLSIGKYVKGDDYWISNN